LQLAAVFPALLCIPPYCTFKSEFSLIQFAFSAGLPHYQFPSLTPKQTWLLADCGFLRRVPISSGPIPRPIVSSNLYPTFDVGITLEAPHAFVIIKVHNPLLNLNLYIKKTASRVLWRSESNRRTWQSRHLAVRRRHISNHEVKRRYWAWSP
jgi:hypothetical protein